MSYKQFIQELEDDILPAEAERRSDLECFRVYQFNLTGLAPFPIKVCLYLAPCVSFPFCFIANFTNWLSMIRYQEYRTEYITTQKRTYFNAHKDEEWYFISLFFFWYFFLKKLLLTPHFLPDMTLFICLG